MSNTSGETPKLKKSSIEEFERGNLITGPAVLENTNGEMAGAIRIIYSVRTEPLEIEGRIAKEVVCDTIDRGVRFILDPRTDLYFDWKQGIGEFSSRGVKYKIRPILPEDEENIITVK
jgi:hypothetical protein